jgi:hypothetical protein
MVRSRMTKLISGLLRKISTVEVKKAALERADRWKL